MSINLDAPHNLSARRLLHSMRIYNCSVQKPYWNALPKDRHREGPFVSILGRLVFIQ